MKKEKKVLSKKTKGRILAERLGNDAPNELTPSRYKDILEHSLGYTIESGYYTTACRAVSLGSTPENEGFTASKVIGNPKKGIKYPAFIGKGITFDSGGYSIKPSKGMSSMKFDMMGSAVIAGAVLDLNDNKEVPLLSVLCVSENRIGSNAMLPGHKIEYQKGTTIIVEDTDAEGRLVLTDGILLAKNRGTASVIVTVATLTGAIIGALGENTVGAFCTSDEHWLLVEEAFKGQGVGVWRMPFLEEETKAEMVINKKTIKNCVHGSKVPGASYAASFLKHFVGDTPFIHLDIAGVDSKDGKARSELVNVLSKLAGLLNSYS